MAAGQLFEQSPQSSAHRQSLGQDNHTDQITFSTLRFATYPVNLPLWLIFVILEIFLTTDHTMSTESTTAP